MLGRGRVEYTHTYTHLYFHDSQYTFLINYFGQLLRRWPSSTSYPHSAGWWVICLQPSALFALCLWPVPQVYPYALDQSHRVFSLCKGAVPPTYHSDCRREVNSPYLKCQFIVPTLSHLIKIQFASMAEISFSF